MTFRVRWSDRALDELTTLWIRADTDHRRAITSASQAIDQQLSLNPHAVVP